MLPIASSNPPVWVELISGKAFDSSAKATTVSNAEAAVPRLYSASEMAFAYPVGDIP